MRLAAKISRLIHFNSDRSEKAVRNIAISFGAKGVCIVVSLLLVPMTINYVNPTRYGIWLTLSQIIGWVAFFDLGLGNGFRNRFAEAKAKGDTLLARQYLSTTYFSIACLALIIFLFASIANQYVDWSSLLRVENSYSSELKKVFEVVCCFFCLNMVTSIFSTLLTADQKPGFASVINCIGQTVSLLVIFILTKVSKGSLLNLAVYYAGIPCLVMGVASVIAFKFTKYRVISPKLSMFRFDLIRDILCLGLRFFIICVSMISIFQVTNIILSRELGPESVTEYNVSFKYFNILYSVMIIAITPFWSACTDAYVQKDYPWLKTVVKKLEKTWLVSIAVGCIMLAVSPSFFRLWVGDKVQVHFLLSAFMLAYMLAQIIGNIYMYIINGIGTVFIQLIVYLAASIIAWPALTHLCRAFGVAGITIFPAIVFIAQAVLSKIQINKILSGQTDGLWGR